MSDTLSQPPAKNNVMWSVVLADLRSQMTQQVFDINLAGSTATLDNNRLTIRLPAQGAADRLTHQAIGKQVARAVKTHYGDVDVIFEAMERELVEVQNTFADMPSVETESVTELKGFTPVLDSLSDEYSLTTACLFGIIWRHCQMRDKTCRCSVSTMCKLLRCSRATYYRHIKTLLADGLIKDITPLSVGGDKPRWYQVVKTPKVKQQVEIEL